MMRRGWTERFLRGLLPRERADGVLGDLERERAEHGAGKAWLVFMGARIALRLRLGRAVDSVRDWTSGGLVGVTSDVRYALRGVRRSAALLLLATGVLALGIAAPTTMYSIGRGLMREMPVPEPERLVHVGYTSPSSRGPGDIRQEDLAVLRARGGLAATIAGYRRYPFDLTSEGRDPQRVDGAHVTTDLFGVLRTPPVMGRDFVPADARPGAPPVALIGERLWRERFDHDPATVGSTVRVNGVLHTVVGVIPEPIRFPAGAELWVPVSLDGWESYSPPMRVNGVVVPARGNPMLRSPMGGIARIPDGESFERIDAELSGIGLPDRNLMPAEVPERRVVVRPYAHALFSLDARMLYRAMLALISCILFVACANVANLLLARAVFRQRETAVRVALGAGRARIVLHHLAEASAVAAIGGLGALLLTRVALGLFARAIGSELEWYQVIRLDGWTLLFATMVSGLAALVAGVLPGLHLAGRDVGALGTGARGGMDVRIARLTQALTLVQVALSTIALTIAGLVVREFSSSLPERTEQAIRPVLMAEYQGFRLWPVEEYAARAFHRRVHEELAVQPGVEAAALTGSVPGWSRMQRAFRIEGIPVVNGHEPMAQMYEVSPGYPAVMGASILRGRDLTWSDGESDPPAVLVNERFSPVMVGGKDPIGMQLWVPDLSDRRSVVATIVGVVPVINEDQPLTNGVAIYRPLGSAPRQVHVLMRAPPGSAPLRLVPSLRRGMGAVDPDRPLFSVTPLRDEIERLERFGRFFRGFFFLFGAAGLLMAATGLYGVVSFGVARRTNEIGVRMALGAGRRRLAWAVVRAPALRVMLGVAVGLIGVRLGAPGFAGALGVRNPADPLPYVGVLILLLATSLAAAAAPLRRALAIQPTEALRSD
jgi:putative ABC transport system permease protein